MPNKATVGIIAICLATTLWGLDGVVLTPQLYSLSAAYVVMAIHLVPFVLMNFFMFSQYRFLSVFTPGDWLVLLAIVLFGGAGGTLAIVKALFLVNFESLSVVVLLQKLQPVFAISLASLLLGEKVHRHVLRWAFLAIVSGYFLTFGWHLPNFQTGEHTTNAAFYALLAAFSFGAATVFGRKVLLKYPFTTVTFYRYGLTGILMLAWVLIAGLYEQLDITTSHHWLIIALISLTTGSGAIFFYYFGLRNVRAQVATIAELCFPLSAVIFDYLIHQNQLSVIQWVGAATMIFSIIKLTRQEVQVP